MSRLRYHKVWDSVVFFGSARMQPQDRAEEMQRTAQEVVDSYKDADVPEEAKRALQEAKIHLKNSRYYEDARELSRLLSGWFKTMPEKEQMVVCSGGGPGIMEAANRGAHEAGHKSIGLNISLPFEQYPNEYITPELNFEFHYFFMRKFWFTYPSRGIVFFPGGFGTMDEMMEVLTLVQTDKLKKKLSMVLYGSDFWNKIINFQGMVEEMVISPEDLDLFRICDTPQDAFNHLKLELTRGTVANE
ncbi:MAG: TIGR00730 family Rossman fold protein [Ectothiorhodospiraceae bacterium]|nr:TIGR00730 family Rossman fold protein [Ectothiorhodospiraceae bacterium]